MTKILFVCMGNICRSPAAEGILRSKLESLKKVEGRDYLIDSAATTRTHEGSGPDPRSTEVMKAHGLDISKQISRPLAQEDGEKFDLILCMDESNLRDVKRLLPKKYHPKIKLLDRQEVEDPYWRNDGFDRMYEHIDGAVDDLITEQFAK